LAHVKRGHVKWAWVDIPADMIPFFGNALSRAREYTCDRIAQALVPEGATMGLVALAAGTKIYRRVNLKALYEQQDSEWNFWTWFSEIHSTHPNLLNRIRALGLRNEQIKRIKEFENNAKK
jgi:Zn-dependent protease with chaperone function